MPYSLQMPTANDPQPKWDSWQRLHPFRLLRISFHAWCECRWRTALVWQRIRSFQFAVRCFVNFKMRQRTCKNPITEDVIARRESGLLLQKGSVEGSANYSLHLSPKWLLLHKSWLEGSASCALHLSPSLLVGSKLRELLTCLIHTNPVRRKRPITSLLLGYSLGLFNVTSYYFGWIFTGFLGSICEAVSLLQDIDFGRCVHWIIAVHISIQLLIQTLGVVETWVNCWAMKKALVV